MENEIRLRACVVAIHDGNILLVPHIDEEGNAAQWNLPGGSVRFGERLRAAAERELAEETGLQVQVGDLLEVSEVLLPEKPWHSVTVTFWGRVTGGSLTPETGHRFGKKEPRWIPIDELPGLKYHPPEAIHKALAVLPGKGDF